MGKNWRRGLVGLVLAILSASPSLAQQQTQCITNALAGGTPDAITVPNLPCGTATNMLILTLAGANTTNSPTLKMPSSPALPIYDSNGASLAPGDLPKAGAVVMLSGTGSAWLLMANGIPGPSVSGATVYIDTVAGTLNPSTHGQILEINKTVPAATSVVLPAITNWPACSSSINSCPVYTVKDGAGNAGTYPITVTTADSVGFDIGTKVVLDSNNQALDFVDDGTKWIVK